MKLFAFPPLWWAPRCNIPYPLTVCLHSFVHFGVWWFLSVWVWWLLCFLCVLCVAWPILRIWFFFFAFVFIACLVFNRFRFFVCFMSFIVFFVCVFLLSAVFCFEDWLPLLFFYGLVCLLICLFVVWWLCLWFAYFVLRFPCHSYFVFLLSGVIAIFLLLHLLGCLAFFLFACLDFACVVLICCSYIRLPCYCFFACFLWTRARFYSIASRRFFCFYCLKAMLSNILHML